MSARFYAAVATIGDRRSRKYFLRGSGLPAFPQPLVAPGFRSTRRPLCRWGIPISFLRRDFQSNAIDALDLGDFPIVNGDLNGTIPHGADRLDQRFHPRFLRRNVADGFRGCILPSRRWVRRWHVYLVNRIPLARGKLFKHRPLNERTSLLYSINRDIYRTHDHSSSELPRS